MRGDDEGFLSRWARRKADARRGVVAPQPATPDAPATPPGGRSSAAAHGAVTRPAAPTPQAPAAMPASITAADEPRAAPPTLAEVGQLSGDSDYTRFVAADVDPQVRNAAMRKLFSDPQFNVMDGLDVYIDDYNAPNPIPAAMRRRLEEHAAHRAREALQPDGAAQTPRTETAAVVPSAVSPDGAAATALPQSAAPESLATLRPETDEDTALRLQPDDAADAAGAGAHRPGPRA